MTAKKIAKKIAKKKTCVKPESILVLRTCAADLTSYGGFKWPAKGPVRAPDWDPAPLCGSGLYGLAWGVGAGNLLNWNEAARWLVVEVAKKDIVDLDGKIKFPRGRVVYCGERKAAIDMILADPRRPHDVGACVGAVISAGSYGQASAGYGGQASAGSYGQASAGYGGQASAGSYGQASAGYGGQASAGENGAVIVRYWDSKSDRYRVCVGYVGEDGIEADVFYQVFYGRLVKSVPQPARLDPSKVAADARRLQEGK